MNRSNNPKLTPVAQTLRKNMTKEERRLWYDFLRKLPVTVNRQKVIHRFVVDFFCAKANVVIELDGAQHFSEDGKAKDRERDAYMNALGYRVLRYSNAEIAKNFEGVCADIMRNLGLEEESRPLQKPSP